MGKTKYEVTNKAVPFSKFWVMVWNFKKASDGDIPTKIDSAQTSWENNSVSGQYNNKITYEHRDDELLGVTKSSSTHVATIVKDKSFLQQHDKSILKRDSTQVFSCEYCKIFKNTYFEEHLGTAASWKRVYKHLLKTIKSKKQSFTATTDSTNLAQVAVASFELAPCTKQEWADGGRKDPIEVTMVNTFCSRERESFFNKTSL